MHPMRDFSADLARSYLKLAALRERASYNLPRAAARLRELVRGGPVRVPDLAWLASVPEAAMAPAAETTGNPFFGHLPLSPGLAARVSDTRPAADVEEKEMAGSLVAICLFVVGVVVWTLRLACEWR